MLSIQLALTILLLGQTSLAAPVLKRQLAGEGSACNSIFTSTDNGIGYGIQYAEENLAKSLSSFKQRQLHGEGEACDSILTQTDNGVGYGIENAENNVATNIAGLTGNKVTGGGTSTGSGSKAPAPAPAPGKPQPRPHKRQLDKIANGFGEIGQAAGIESIVDPLVTQLDSLDGTLTDGAANLGSDIGTTEVSSLEALGSAVPAKQKRQADKIAYGAAALGEVGGLSKFTGPIATSIESLDGTLTDGVANLGSGVADSEESMLEGTGSAVPVLF
jgi:hypothetical protein